MKRICLNHSVLEHLEARLTRSTSVLEFGAGYSTAWLAERCGDLHSIETSPEWAMKAAAELSDDGAARVRIHVAPDIRDAVLKIPPAWTPDLVLIDCVSAQRHVAMHLTAMLVTPGAEILFDDAQRVQHRQAIRMLADEYGEPEILRYDPGHDVPAAKERTTAVFQVPGK